MLSNSSLNWILLPVPPLHLKIADFFLLLFDIYWQIRLSNLDPHHFLVESLPVYCIYSSFRAMFASFMILVGLLKGSRPMGCISHLWNFGLQICFLRNTFFCSRIFTFSVMWLFHVWVIFWCWQTLTYPTWHLTL